MIASVSSGVLPPSQVDSLLLLFVLFSGSLALWFWLSDARAAFGRGSKVRGVSVTAVLIVLVVGVFVCLPGGRSLGAAVDFVFSAPQGRFAQRGELDPQIHL